MPLRGSGSASTPPSPARARAGSTPAGTREPRAVGEGRSSAVTVSRGRCRTRTRAGRALTAAVREEAGRRRPTPRGREDGGDGAGGSGSRGGTPAGARDAVGGMDAAIVGTQRRAERAAATQRRRDHQSCSPPQRPCPRSGIPGQSARGSRAGREADQCRAALQAVGGHSSKQPNSTGPPSFPTRLRGEDWGFEGCGAADRAGIRAGTPRPRQLVQRRHPRLVSLEHVQRLEESSFPGFTSPEDARSGCGRPMLTGLAVRWDHLASPEPASLPLGVGGGRVAS